MGVYGALLTGVTGLQGQSTKMGAISDNIANVNTVGYKKADIPFQSLVTNPYSQSFTPGGVLAKPRQLISQQGVISGTASSTDFAISGRGFFIVSEEASASIDNSRFYTRAGSFRTVIDPTDTDNLDKALLQNTGGYYLTGIPIDDRNEIPEPNSLTQLETVDINRQANSARATENFFTQARLPNEATSFGFGQTVYNANGSINTTFTGAETVTLGTITATRPDNVVVTVTPADLFPASAGGRLTGPAATNLTNDAVTIAAGGLDIDIGGTTTNIPLANITSAGFVNGTGDLNDLATALQGLTVGGFDLSASFTADAAGDYLEIRAFNSTTGAEGLVTNVDSGGAVAVASAAALNPGVGAAAVPTEVSLLALRNALSGYTESDVTFTADLSGGSFTITAEQDGTRINMDLTNLDITSVDTADVIAGSTGDWGTIFEPDLTMNQLIYDSLGTARTVQLQWAKVQDEPNLWAVSINDSSISGFRGDTVSTVGYDPSNTNNDNNGARFIVDDGGSAPVETQRLYIKFTGDGALQEVRTTPDGMTGTAFGQRGGGTTSGVVQNRETNASDTPKLIAIAAGPVDVALTDEAVGVPTETLTTANAPFDDASGAQSARAVLYEWNIGRPTGLPGSAAGTGLEGLTQFDSGEPTPAIEVNFQSQDGARFGVLNGVQLDESGILYALFDNGLSEPIYLIPVATFNSPDELLNIQGNAFAESGESGQVQLKRAGDQGAGRTLGSAVENSNVDLGDEFTNMIITQQSFTANTRTITTSDRMLEELVRILR